MPVEPNPVTPDPDEFDRQLRELTSGQAQPVRFVEPSAAERAKRAAERARPPAKPTPRRTSWRSARKARQLRRPVGQAPGDSGYGGARPPKRFGRGQAAGGPTRRSKPLSSRQQRRRTIARTTGIIVGFVVLLFVLHQLGLGPH